MRQCKWVIPKTKKRCITKLCTENKNKYCFSHNIRGTDRDDKAIDNHEQEIVLLRLRIHALQKETAEQIEDMRKKATSLTKKIARLRG